MLGSLYRQRSSGSPLRGSRVGRPRHLQAVPLPTDERLGIAAVPRERAFVDGHLETRWRKPVAGERYRSSRPTARAAVVPTQDLGKLLSLGRRP